MIKVISKSMVFLDTEFGSQNELFKFLATELYNQNRSDSVEEVVKGFYLREEEFSTAVNDGIAIPHCRNHSIKEATVAVIRNKNFVEWSAEDEKCNLFFALMIPEENENQMHIKILAKVAQLIMEDDFIEKIKTYSTEEVFNELKPLNETI